MQLLYFIIFKDKEDHLTCEIRIDSCVCSQLQRIDKKHSDTHLAHLRRFLDLEECLLSRLYEVKQNDAIAMWKTKKQMRNHPNHDDRRTCKAILNDKTINLKP